MSGQLTFAGVLENSRRRPYEDLTKQKFDKLRVLREVEGRDKHGHRVILWECRCVCRKVVFKTTSDLTGDKVTSCGCAKRKRMQALGKERFENLTDRKFGQLTVIRQVKSKSVGNIAWLCHCARCGNEKPILSTNLLSDRSTTCGCAAADKQVKITAFKVTRTLTEWSARSGLSKALIAYRLKRGWTPEDAVSLPAKPGKYQKRKETEHGDR